MSGGSYPRILLTLGLCVALLGLSLPRQAQATTVLKLDMPSLVSLSEQIVIARVIALRAKLERGRVVTYVDLQVERRLKGKGSTKLTIRQLGGKLPDKVTYVPGSPIFYLHHDVVLFLERPKPGAPLVVAGMRQGKFELARGPGGERFVIPDLGNLRLIEKLPNRGVHGVLKPALPARFHKYPLPLQQLEEAIMAELHPNRPALPATIKTPTTSADDSPSSPPSPSGESTQR